MGMTNEELNIIRVVFQGYINDIQKYSTDTNPHDKTIKRLEEIRDKAIKTLEQQQNFEGKTNGDVLQAMFPNEKYEVIARTAFDVNSKIIHHKVVLVNGLLDYYVMDYEWWNAPYKAESEE